MKKLTSRIALAGLMVSGPAWALTGNDLVKMIPPYEGSIGDFSGGMFLGYVVGVAETSNGVLFCSDSGVTNGQNAAIVIKYLRNNPEKWANGANWLVLDALTTAHPPCKSKK